VKHNAQHVDTKRPPEDWEPHSNFPEDEVIARIDGDRPHEPKVDAVCSADVKLVAMRAIVTTLSILMEGGAGKDEIFRRMVLLRQVACPGECTQRESAEMLGVTEARISQLLKSNSQQRAMLSQILALSLKSALQVEQPI
jgi:hypothetical protein